MQTVGRTTIVAIRAALKPLQFVVAEVDSELRYVWIDNPHADFDPTLVIGKRDDELVSRADAEGIMQLKREVLREGNPVNRVLGFQLSSGSRFYSISAFPLTDASGVVDGVFTVAFESPGVLHGIIPICASCKRVRDEHGLWRSVEAYVEERTRAQFSHGLCEACVQTLYPARSKS